MLENRFSEYCFKHQSMGGKLWVVGLPVIIINLYDQQVTLRSGCNRVGLWWVGTR